MRLNNLYSLLKSLWRTVAIVTIIIATYLTVGVPKDYMSTMWWLVNLVGIVFVLAAAFQHKTTQLLSTAFVVVFGVVCWQNQLYANSVVNLFVLLPISIAGIFIWNGDYKWKVKINIPTLLFGNFMFFIFTYWSLVIFNIGQHQLLDALSASMVIVATALLALKDNRCWYWWVTLNTLEVVMWFNIVTVNQDALGLLALRSVFLLNSVIGFIEWNLPKKKVTA